jgi:hypothetical protein
LCLLCSFQKTARSKQSPNSLKFGESGHPDNELHFCPRWTPFSRKKFSSHKKIIHCVPSFWATRWHERPSGRSNESCSGLSHLHMSMFHWNKPNFSCRKNDLIVQTGLYQNYLHTDRQTLLYPKYIPTGKPKYTKITYRQANLIPRSHTYKRGKPSYTKIKHRRVHLSAEIGLKRFVIIFNT